MARVTIGIPVYNRGASLVNLLQNLRQRTPVTIDYEIIVVDDSGKQPHRNITKDACRSYGAVYVEHEKNKGVSTGWNTLVRAGGKSEFCVILNDDVFVSNDWLTYMLYALERNPKVGSFGMNCRFIAKEDAAEIVKGPNAKVIPLNVYWKGGTLIRTERYKSWPVEEDGPPGKVMCPTGCFFGFRREIYDLVGGFDERYFAFYEETDFGVSCAWRGLPSFVLGVPDHNYHMWSASFATAPEVPAGAIMARSRASFVKKWMEILGTTFADAPDIHHLLMDKIPPIEVRWLGVGKVERREML
jgi:GT2 family glycosyltransferase